VNHREAAQIVHEYRKLRKRLGAGASVLVVAFHRPQARLLRELLRTAVDRGDDLRVQTVDEAQGGEADAELLSCVRANAARAVGFLSNPRRVCVALSRAKAELHIFGDRATCMGSRVWARALGLLDELDGWDRGIGQLRPAARGPRGAGAGPPVIGGHDFNKG
jgi:helicase required for RNAi-mediated heterochromatin assembly 1